MQNVSDEEVGKLLDEKPKRTRKKKVVEPVEEKPAPWVARVYRGGEVKTVIEPITPPLEKSERPLPNYVAGPFVLNRRERRALVRAIPRRTATFAQAVRAFTAMTKPKKK